MRVVVVDDEPLALCRLMYILKSEADIDIVGAARDGVEALQVIGRHTPDIVFLDIGMPSLNGLDVVNSLKGVNSPDIVFVTAFDSYAVEAFSIDAVDYLLKPVQPDRLRQSLRRARRRRSERLIPETPETLTPSPLLCIPDRHGGTEINQASIMWIEASRDYGLIHTDHRSYILRITMTELTKRLDSDIVRVHRSAFVALSRVKAIHTNKKSNVVLLLEEGTEIPVGPTYVKNVRIALSRVMLR